MIGSLGETDFPNFLTGPLSRSCNASCGSHGGELLCKCTAVLCHNLTPRSLRYHPPAPFGKYIHNPSSRLYTITFQAVRPITVRRMTSTMVCLSQRAPPSLRTRREYSLNSIPIYCISAHSPTKCVGYRRKGIQKPSNLHA